MPTYVYGCDTCGHRFEQVQKFQDAPLTECPACGARIRRIFQPAGIVFKGSGWHSTDYRSKEQTSARNAEDGGTKTGDEGPKKTGDDGATKPADADKGAAKPAAATPAPAKAAE